MISFYHELMDCTLNMNFFIISDLKLDIYIYLLYSKLYYLEYIDKVQIK